MYFIFNTKKAYKNRAFNQKIKAKKLQTQSQVTKQEKNRNNISVYYRHLTVNCYSYVGIKQPNMTDKDKCYKVYSPEKFKLRPKDDIYLDLKFDIQTPETIKAWLNLLPSFKSLGLHIKNEDWVPNKTKDNTIQLHILNGSFNYIASIKKNNSVLGLFFY